MIKAIERTVRNNQKGFTLLELLAVMAIIAVLAGIVTTSISGTGEASRDAQATQDASTVQSAAAEYFADQEGAEILTPLSKAVLDIPEDIEQVISSRWPENHLTALYPLVFPSDTTDVSGITFLDSEGASLEVVDGTLEVVADFAVEDLLAGYTAVDFDILVNLSYLPEAPSSVDQVSDVYANYLWLFEKADSSGTTANNTSRNIAVFKLIVVQQNSDDSSVALTYQKIV